MKRPWPSPIKTGNGKKLNPENETGKNEISKSYQKKSCPHSKKILKGNTRKLWKLLTFKFFFEYG
jgi:hypothetical protein